MKTLLLMRHAKSDWKQPGLADHDRPLNARGRRAAPVMACHLRDMGITVDAILASTAERVRETVAIMQRDWAQSVEVLTLKSLYLAQPEQIISEVQALHDSWNSVLVVGHNPGLTILVSQLARAGHDMPTAAIALFKIDSPTWQKAFSSSSVVLSHLWKPRDLMPEESC